MTNTAYASKPPPIVRSEDPAILGRPRQGTTASGVLVAVVALDQSTKWWGWRHTESPTVNTGSTWLIGDPVDGLVSGPVSGRLVDLLGLALLGLTGYLLLRRRRQPLLLVAGALMISGWSSNLLDRLGMHMLTAPGMPRGVIDFIPLGPLYFNLADAAIAAATLLYLVVRPAVVPTPALERDEALRSRTNLSPR